MRTSPFRRWIAVAVTAAILVTVLAAVGFRKSKEPNANAKDAKEEPAGHSWPLYGGSVQRNLVNLVEKDMPTNWSVKEGAMKNIKWWVPLGSKAYGGPIVAQGKIFMGTNNQV